MLSSSWHKNLASSFQSYHMIFMPMLSVMEHSHSVCRDSFLVPSPCPSRWPVWWNIIMYRLLQEHHPLGFNFPVFQGDLIVSLPVATFYSHLAVSCQLSWILPRVLQPTAHAAPASTSFAFPGVLECSPDSSSLGSTLCNCVAGWILRFTDVILSDTFYHSTWKDLGWLVFWTHLAFRKKNLGDFSNDYTHLDATKKAGLVFTPKLIKKS